MFVYKNVSVFTAVISLTLCVVLLFFPEFIFYLFQIQAHESAIFIGRRAAMLFFGILIITWHSRNSENSDARQAICLGLMAAMVALASIGIWEFIRGFVGIGIVLAIVTELALAVAYFRIWQKNKN